MLNKLEGREILTQLGIKLETWDLLTSSQALLPPSYWTQVAAECWKMVFP